MSDHVVDHDLAEDELPPVSAGRPPEAIDVLAPPPRPAGTGSARPGMRERIRSSRFGTLVVLLITAGLVAAGMWLVNQGNAQNTAAQTGGATVVKLPGNSKLPPPEVGKPAQDFTATAYDGSSVSLSGLRGKAVWLTFGASWCTGCQAEVPDIEAAHKAFASQGVVVLGINITEDNTAVKAYAQRVGLTYPIAADPNSAVADVYSVSAIPAHYFIDRDGVVRDIRVGALSPDTMKAILSKLVTSS